MPPDAHPPIDVTVPGSKADPRADSADPPGVVVHRVPALHPDDVVTLPNGLRVTSVARTLIDLADELTVDELRETFAIAQEKGLLDMEALRRSRERIEWRPSLSMLDAVIEEFEGSGWTIPVERLRRRFPRKRFSTRMGYENPARARVDAPAHDH